MLLLPELLPLLLPTSQPVPLPIPLTYHPYANFQILFLDNLYNYTTQWGVYICYHW